MFEISLFHYLILSAALFCIGLLGVMISRNLIRVFMSLELMLNAANINFIAFSYYCDGFLLSGNLFVLFVMGVAVCEMAVGLVIVIALTRNSKNIDVNEQNLLGEDK